MPDAMLASLRSTPDEALGIDDGLLQRIMSAFSFAPSARVARAASQGTFHRLYEVHEPGRPMRMLRVAAVPGAESENVMALEAAVMAALRERGFAIPACEFRAVAGRGAHSMERADGASLTTLDSDEAAMVEALAHVARFLARLHGIRGRGYGPVSQASWPQWAGVHANWDDFVLLRLREHVAECVRMNAMSGVEAQGVARLFDDARGMLRAQPAVLCHGDPGSHNFVLDANGIRAVLDWEDAILGDPLFDLASLCTFHPERRHGAIFSAYGVELTAGGEAWRRFWLYFLRISLAKTVHRHRFAYADRPDRAPASSRIQLALERLRGAAP